MSTPGTTGRDNAAWRAAEPVVRDLSTALRGTNAVGESSPLVDPSADSLTFLSHVVNWLRSNGWVIFRGGDATGQAINPVACEAAADALREWLYEDEVDCAARAEDALRAALPYLSAADVPHLVAPAAAHGTEWADDDNAEEHAARTQRRTGQYVSGS